MNLIDDIRSSWAGAANLTMRKLIALGFEYEDRGRYFVIYHPNNKMCGYNIESKNALMMFFYGYMIDKPTLIITPVDSF